MKREKSVLLIDDDHLYNQIQSIELEEMKFWDRIISVDSREEAISFLTACFQANDIPELIFMDLNMASMSLEEFLNKIKSSYTSSFPRIIITSAHFNSGSIKELKLLGFDDFITKPITSQKITSLLSKVKGEVK